MNQKSSLFNFFIILILIALTVVIVIIRIRMLNVPLERDEGEYAYAGQLILEGVPPYSLVYNMKMPGIYAAYALVLACFGQTQTGIHLGLLIMNTVTVSLLFLLAKKLFGIIAGLASAIFFSLMSVSGSVQGIFANAEHFVVLFGLGGILLLVYSIEKNKSLYLVFGSIMMGISFLMKQHGFGFILFGFIYLLSEKFFYCHELSWKKIFRVSVIYVFFVILPFLITCLILYWCGVFKNFWFWTMTYASYYVRRVSLENGIFLFNYAAVRIFLSGIFIWISALIGFLWCPFSNKTQRYGTFLISFFVCSFVSICPGLYFRPHYFILILPSVSLLAAIGMNAIQNLLGKIVKSTIKIFLITILFILIVWLHSFYSQRSFLTESHGNLLLQSDPTIISRLIYGTQPFPESLKIATYIQEHSQPDDKILILGSEPQILFYSQRRSATSYIYMYPLVEEHPYVLQMQKEMVSQIEANKPKFIIFVQVTSSWCFSEKFEQYVFSWADKYLKSYYCQVGIIDIISPLETLYLWETTAQPTKSIGFIAVFERRY